MDDLLTPLVASGKYDGHLLVDDPEIRKENLFDNVVLGFQRMSAEHPLLLFLDDLQWADHSTLGLLHYLARNTRLSRVLIMGTYRTEEILKAGGRHQLERELVGTPRPWTVIRPLLSSL